MSPARTRTLVVVAGLALCLYTATHMRMETDITSFMPTGSDRTWASLSKALSDSELTRTMVLTVSAGSAEDVDASVALAQRLAAHLRAHPEVAWARSGLDPDQFEKIYALYFPRRHYFLSDEPERELPLLLAGPGLRERAAQLRRELAGPSGLLLKRIASADPLLAFESILRRIRAGERSLALRDGTFVTADERFAVVFAGTHASAFDSARQSSVLEHIAAFADESRGAGGVQLEQSGVNRFFVQVENSIVSDIRMIAVSSAIGVAVLFISFFRSLRAFLIAVVPHASGVMIAAAAGLLIFGSLNGLAIAFGISLIGVSIDYSIHVLNHNAMTAGESASETVRRLRPSLVLGGLTTIASLTGLAFTSFPGFTQMGVLATVGVGSALLITLFVLPAFMAGARSAPISHRFAGALGDAVRGLGRVRAYLVAVPFACLLGAFWGFPQLRFVDDMSALTSIDPALRAEDERVRARVSRFDGGRFVVAIGEDMEAALASNDRVYGRMEELERAGALAGFRSLHAFLWSEELQRANAERVRGDPDLPERLAAAYAEVGFRPDSFAEFGADVSESDPGPLRYAEIAASPLADLVRPLVIELAERIAIITYLEGVTDVAAIEGALADLDGAELFDQKRFLRSVYAEYRARSANVLILGAIAVLALLFARYRRARPTLAAFLPSALVAALLIALAAGFRVDVNILHLMGLTLVLGMGVDYGIFIVDSSQSTEEVGVTMLSLLLSCLTTIFIFGVLAISQHPVLNAIGITAGVGVALSFLLAPVALVLVGSGQTTRRE